ncbi:MAG: peptidase [Microvirga sp.]|jgi:isopenicillin-N N-acyltransferase-like protein|nr:peptidase [Microvirga sp.]
MTLPIPVIEITGTPAERGYAYGRAAADRIARSFELYGGAMEKRGVAWNDALAAAPKFFDEIDKLEPAMAEELRGIAEGSGVSLEGVVIVNARSEIMHRLAPKAAAIDLQDGCTGIIVQPEATADKFLIHAQNWDWMLAARETVVLLRVRDADHELLTFVEAGGLARCGLNSAGLALTGNSLRIDTALPETGLPISLIRRKVLAARSFSEALSAIYKSPRGCANNMMLSHATGEAIDLETTPREVFWLAPSDGLLVHANHFRSEAARAKLYDAGVALAPDSLSRELRLERLLRAKCGTIRVDDVISALHDTWGAPDGVLTLPQEEWPCVLIGTTATIVMVPERGELYYCNEPDRSPVFHRVSLTQGISDQPGSRQPIHAC